MPFLEGITFTGKLGDLSAYRMRGCSKIVVRRKGGPNPDELKKGANFINTRRTMSEFGGCSRMGWHVRMTMNPIRRLADYNFGSDINSIMRRVQLQDGTSDWGRRNIILSDHARILEGFSTTQEMPRFDSIVRNPAYYTLDRATCSARVDIPELMHSINYFPQNNHALFRITATLGIVPDLFFDVAKKEYLPHAWYNRGAFGVDASTEWCPSLEGMDATTLQLSMDQTPPEEGWTLMLSIGIEFGSLREGGHIKEVKRFGAAKILALRGREASVEQGPEGNDPGSEEEVMLREPAPVQNLNFTVTRSQSEPRQASKKAPEADRQVNDQRRPQTLQMIYQYTAKTEPAQTEARMYTYAMVISASKEQAAPLLQNLTARAVYAVVTTALLGCPSPRETIAYTNAHRQTRLVT
ncbi:hypothetical protein KK062_17825 [Fulvivirgaceae bacterium PWU5]|uniref:Uncharacterized protein n=1 Tax=Dawidia cretensis TaxID=2782350 RepID=A0AAP2DZL6_9BACT|nr:hypothetical protein [Dawidia cretensis]MBT1710110.1 hypothetical protein [Dawidia cretensis]